MQPVNPDQCPICRKNAEHQIHDLPGDLFRVQCSLCGKYTISMDLCEDLPAEIGDLRPYLTAATRQASEFGIPLELTQGNWREQAEAHKHTSWQAKVEKLLRVIEKRTKEHGLATVVRSESDYPLIDAADQDAVRYFLDYLEADRQFIKCGDNRQIVTLTPKGWDYLDPGSGGGGIPGRVFVAMSFDPSLNDAYRLGIKPAIETDCDLEARRVDKITHNQKICDRILVEIRRCQFVVADYTLHRGGVYFEDGFAMGLGREVVRTCREDDLKNAHFDTRQYPHVTWSDIDSLRG